MVLEDQERHRILPPPSTPRFAGGCRCSTRVARSSARSLGPVPRCAGVVARGSPDRGNRRDGRLGPGPSRLRLPPRRLPRQQRPAPQGLASNPAGRRRPIARIRRPASCPALLGPQPRRWIAAPNGLRPACRVVPGQASTSLHTFRLPPRGLAGTGGRGGSSEGPMIPPGSIQGNSPVFLAALADRAGSPSEAAPCASSG